MKKNSLSKMQRKVHSRRKKWTNKERFDNKIKNAIRNENNPLILKALNERLAAMKAEIKARGLSVPDDQITLKPEEMPDEPPQHDHSDACNHG